METFKVPHFSQGKIESLPFVRKSLIHGVGKSSSFLAEFSINFSIPHSVKTCSYKAVFRSHMFSPWAGLHCCPPDLRPALPLPVNMEKGVRMRGELALFTLVFSHPLPVVFNIHPVLPGKWHGACPTFSLTLTLQPDMGQLHPRGLVLKTA